MNRIYFYQLLILLMVIYHILDKNKSNIRYYTLVFLDLLDTS